MFSAMWWPSEKDQMRLLSLGHATLWGMRSFSLYMENYIYGYIYMCMYEYRNSNHGNRKTVGFLTIPFCNNFYSCSLLDCLSMCGWITSSPWWSPHLQSLFQIPSVSKLGLSLVVEVLLESFQSPAFLPTAAPVPVWGSSPEPRSCFWSPKLSPQPAALTIHK